MTTKISKGRYVSYFCWKQNNRLNIVSNPNINHNGCKFSAPFKENLYDNFIVNSLSTSRRFQSQNYYYCVLPEWFQKYSRKYLAPLKLFPQLSEQRHSHHKQQPHQCLTQPSQVWPVKENQKLPLHQTNQENNLSSKILSLTITLPFSLLKLMVWNHASNSGLANLSFYFGIDKIPGYMIRSPKKSMKISNHILPSFFFP